MKKSFKDEEREVVEGVVDEEALMEIDGDSEAVALSDINIGMNSVSGPVDRRDIIIPSVKIVQSVGPLSVKFPNGGGKVVLNGELVIVNLEEPVELTVVGINKKYIEDLPYDPEGKGPKPEIWTTYEAMVKAGKWADWRNNVRPPAKEVATAVVLIKQPDSLDDPRFHLTGPDGGKYVMAKWILQGTSYTRGAKPIFTACATSLLDTGVASGKWRMFTHRVKAGPNYVFAPNLTQIGTHDEEFMAFIGRMMGA